jgi:hypothetical protein
MKLVKYLRNGILSAALLMAGCKEYKTEYSEVMHENATVASMYHEDNWIQMMPVMIGDNVGIIPISHPEINWITFDGQVDFDIDNEEIFNRFNKNDSADISYREIYRTVYDDGDGDGKKELLEKKIRGYYFIDAQRPKN